MTFDAAGELERFLSEAATRAERAVALEEEVADLVGEATSEDGLITVRADAADPLRDLWIDTRALRWGGEELAAWIVAVAREARLDLDRKVNECRAASSEEDFGPAEAAALMEQTGRIAASVSGAAAELVQRIGRMAG